MEPIPDGSPRRIARIAGVFYLLVFVTGTFGLVLVNGTGRTVANLISTALYIVVTALFYRLFKPVNSAISLVAACFSLAGCAVTFLNAFRAAPVGVNPLAIFGCYCLLIGYLILRSSFLPRFLGVLMAFGGLGWLTFASAQLARSLSPWNFVPGILGEAALTVWLISTGVNAERWNAQAHAEVHA
jgi:hypothetical protein